MLAVRYSVDIPATTYHVDDLLQRQSELHLQRLRFIGHRSLQGVVCGEQVVQQSLLVRSLTAFCKKSVEKIKFNKFKDVKEEK